MGTRCYYHSDLDGRCAGAIVKYQVPDCEMIQIDYGDELPWEELEGETVYMVDFHMNDVGDQLRLDEICKKVIWIDHHKSAVDNLDEIAKHRGLYKTEAFVVDDGRAGCELTWEWFHGRKAMPLAVHLLGRYDVWDHSDQRVVPFQYGMRMRDTRPSGLLWTMLLERSDAWNTIEEKIIAEGCLILGYIEQSNKEYVQRRAFEKEFEATTASCVMVLKGLSYSSLCMTRIDTISW